MVSLAFPPKLDAEVLQTAKAHKYLSGLPHTQVHVATSRETGDPLSLLRPRVVTKDGVSDFDLYRNRYVDYAMLRWAPGLASRPDIKGRAVRSWRAIAAALPWRPDIVLSRSYPITSALLGQKLADYFSVPWIMQLSDPWLLYPLHPQGYAYEWNAAREAEAFARADLITFTSQRTLARYVKAYPRAASRFRYFPNTYDPDEVRPNPWSKRARMRFVYAGTLGGSRTPDAFCDAIEAFFARRPEAVGDVEVVAAGHASREVRRTFEAKASYMQYIGPVDFGASMELVRSADVLLLIDNVMSEEQREKGGAYEFFPSKLLDYMIAQRPIIAISDQDSISTELIREQKLGESFAHGDLAGASAAIETAWTNWRDCVSSAFHVDARSQAFDARVGAVRLRNEIEGLLHER